MFANIDSNFVLKTTLREFRTTYKLPKTESVVKNYQLCLTCNNSVFNGKNYWQTNDTIQQLHLSYFYADLALAIV